MVEKRERNQEAPGGAVGIENEIAVAERRGSHLLVRRGGSFAVVERREGKIYGIGGKDRRPFPDTSEGITAAVGNGWTDEAAARALFGDVVSRGESLARRIW